MYAFQQYDSERMARASRRNEAISFKQSVELARELRGMLSDRALSFLEAVIAKRTPVKFTRFTDGAGHKRGIGPGKYPVKAAATFKLLLESAIANAENKGLGTPLKIVSVVANNGNGGAHYGRKRSRQTKSTHLQIVVAESGESNRGERKAKKKVVEKSSESKKGLPSEPSSIKSPKRKPSGQKSAEVNVADADVADAVVADAVVADAVVADADVAEAKGADAESKRATGTGEKKSETKSAEPVVEKKEVN